MGTKRLKVCEDEFTEASNTDRGDGGEDHPWVIRPLGLQVTPVSSAVSHSVIPHFCSLCCLPWVLHAPVICSRLPPQPVEQLRKINTTSSCTESCYINSSSVCQRIGLLLILSAFSLLAIFSASQSLSPLQPAVHFLPPKYRPPTPSPFPEKNKTVLISFHKLTKSKPTYQRSGTKTNHNQDTFSLAHWAAMYVISEKLGKKGDFCNVPVVC